MTQKKYQAFGIFTRKATQHMSGKKYSWAMVYLCDTLKQIQKLASTIEDEEEKQKFNKQVKLPCHKNLSLCYLKQGNYTDCIEQCKAVLEFQPHSAKILYRIGNAYMNLNDLENAQKYLKHAFLLEPNEKEIMKALQRIQCLRISKSHRIKQIKKQQSRITLLTLIVLIFFWPIITFHFLYRKIVPQKTKFS